MTLYVLELRPFVFPRKFIGSAGEQVATQCEAKRFNSATEAVIFGAQFVSFETQFQLITDDKGPRYTAA